MIETKINKRLNLKSIGYKTEVEKERINQSNILQHITPKDVRSFGLIPEIIGRLPVLSYLSPLDHFALKEILTKPRNSLIKQYEKLFEMDSIDLKFTTNSLHC